MGASSHQPIPPILGVSATQRSPTCRQRYIPAPARGSRGRCTFPPAGGTVEHPPHSRAAVPRRKAERWTAEHSTLPRTYGTKPGEPQNKPAVWFGKFLFPRVLQTPPASLGANVHPRSEDIKVVALPSGGFKLPVPGGQRAAAGHRQHPCGPRGAGQGPAAGRPPRPPEQVRTRDSNRTASPGAGAGQRYLWYCACRNWNSSLIRSQDSEMVNLKGCAGWCGACKQATRSFRRPSVAPRPRPRALRHGHGGLGSAGVRPAGPGRAARGSNSGRRRRTTIRKWLQLGGPCCTHRVPGLDRKSVV